MTLYTDINNLPNFKNTVLTIGSFDGVHKGHRKILEYLKTEAIGINGESVVITFDPHPRLVLNPDDNSLVLLTTLEEKICLLEQTGIDVLAVVPFTKEFSELSAKAYLEDFLVKNFHPSRIIIGYDHHFGAGRKGNIALLKEQETKYKYKVIEIPKQEIKDITISSTKIREAIKTGDISLANELLGYNYTFSGKVVHGEKIGRTLGFPTANLEIRNRHKLLPGAGVYTVMVSLDEKRYGALLSIGTKPTFNGTQVFTEVYILDFNDDIYGKQLDVEVLDMIRKEHKFSNMDELIKAMQNDEKMAREFLETIN